MGQVVQVFTDDALGDLDGVGVAQRIAAGEISAAEVVDAAIARASKADVELNAVQYEAFDRARAAARSVRASTDQPFAGVPSFIKDNNDVAGMPTCHGSAALSPHPVKRTYPCAEQFLAQGYVVLGKSTMPEFGLTATTEFFDRPPTRNPWNPDFSAGASSGGSAALVASGAVPIAHANDGGGSIRIPAAACGLVGLKTTRARLLDEPGARLLPVNVAAEGVVSRTVRDTAHHLAAMERTHRNRRLPVVGLVEGPGTRRLRIGLATASPNGVELHHETLAQVRATAELLASLGHDVDEVTLPVDPRFERDFGLYWGFFADLLSLSARLAHRGHYDATKLDPFTKGLAAMWRRDMTRLPGAIRSLRSAVASYDAMFVDRDVVLSPTLNHPTPELCYLSPNVDFEEVFGRLTRYVGFTPINNVSGGPAISLPTPVGANNLPGAVHLSAARGDERTLLQLAYELEQARPFPTLATQR